MTQQSDAELISVIHTSPGQEAKTFLFYHSNKRLSQQGESYLFFSKVFKWCKQTSAHYPALQCPHVGLKMWSTSSVHARFPVPASTQNSECRGREADLKAVEVPKLEEESLFFCLSFMACPDSVFWVKGIQVGVQNLSPPPFFMFFSSLCSAWINP